MRGLEKLESAELHVRDIPPQQFDLKPVARVRAPEQHGLVFELHALLTILENRLDDVLGFCISVFDGNVSRRRPLAATREQVFAILTLTVGDQAIRAVENGLGRTVVFFERNDFGRGHELIGEIKDIVDGSRAKRIDRLGIVSDDAQTAAVGLQSKQDISLDPVGVLVLVNEHVIEPAAYRRGELLLSDEMSEVQQQVVVVQRLHFELALDVASIKRPELLLPVRTPRESLVNDDPEVSPCVYRARVDSKARVLLRKAPGALRQTELVTNHIHEIRRIAAIQNRE